MPALKQKTRTYNLPDHPRMSKGDGGCVRLFTGCGDTIISCVVDPANGLAGIAFSVPRDATGKIGKIGEYSPHYSGQPLSKLSPIFMDMTSNPQAMRLLARLATDAAEWLESQPRNLEASE